jgi:hypothetical protein
MRLVNLDMASRLPQSFRLALLNRPHDTELRHHLEADQPNPIGRAVETQSHMNLSRSTAVINLPGRA